ncbi:MAG: arginine--tRNA ligase [Bacilli bacterium]|nr:arginine--tRNA ligase [Bacilli bacterium]
MSFIKETENYITNVIKKCGYEVDNVILESSSRRDLGEFQINVCMGLAKKYGKNPREIAESIISEFDDRFYSVNIAGPGFINVSISDKYLLEYINSNIKDTTGFVDKGDEKTIIVDYGGANAAKVLHVGHMRPANIGESLKRLAELLGNKTIGDVHLGDIGRQSGMIISEIKKRKPDLCYFDSEYKGEYPKLEISTEELGEYYPAASVDAKENPERMEEVRKITALVDEGKEPYFSMWKDIVEVSKESIKKSYDYLNCNFDLWEGELSSLEYVPDTLKVLEPYMYISDGAKVIDVKKDDDKIDIPPLIVIKNDGATIYATRDLATIYSRVKKYNPDEIWYIVDARQAMYFEQVFRASYKSHLVRDDVKLAHYWFGTMNGSDGKPFKTRDGGVMSLDMLVDQVKEKLLAKLDKYTEEEKKNIADVLTVATIKYADLLPYRTTDFIFDIDKITSFEGKTGPYVLYTMVRIKSILDKVNIDNPSIKSIYSETERNIYIKLLELAKTLTKAYNEKTLSYICEYLFDLCSLFNKFYGECNIINEKDMSKKESYVALLNLLYNTGNMLLNILAIEIPDKM